MPTITLSIGQCGNQLGDTLWPLLFQQHHQASSAADAGWLGREFFSTSSSSACGDCVLMPRVVCVDSEAKVVRSSSSVDHRVHVLGHGGCGNNWACGYSFGAGRASAAGGSAWNSSDDAVSRVEQVLEGVRKECELSAGVPDFLLLASLAGGTGSGTGSALLEALADGFPASTLGAVAVAPGHSGDSTVQSINSCLALQRLQLHAHAVVLVDNQAILDQLNSTAAGTSSASSKQPAAAAGAAARAAAAPAGACLQGVNRVAAEALAGLLWPVSNEDLLAGRSSLRQLASTVCGDPRTRFVEAVSLSQPEAAWTTPASSSSSTRGGSAAAGNPWPARVKLLAAQLPRYDPMCRDTHVSTSAALVITRGLPGTCNPGMSAGRPPQQAAAPTAPWLASARPEVAASCWHSGGAGVGWQQQLAGAVCCSWPFFAGSEADVHIGASPVPLWSAVSGATRGSSSSGGSAAQPSMTAAVRRSSVGSLMQAAAQRALQLSAAGAYMHWYESYGTTREDIEQAAFAVADAGEAYLTSPSGA